MSDRESKWDSKNNHHYQSAEYRKNRKKVIERDWNCCMRCWYLRGVLNSENIECDHFFNISGGNVDHSTSNLILLCRSCHALKTAQESNGKFNPSKPFGDYDIDDDRWPVDINWLDIIRRRERGDTL